MFYGKPIMKLNERLSMAKYTQFISDKLENAYYEFASEPKDFDDFIHEHIPQIIASTLDHIGPEYDDVNVTVSFSSKSSLSGQFKPGEMTLTIGTNDKRYLKLKELTAKPTRDKRTWDEFNTRLFYPYIRDISSIVLHEIEHANQANKIGTIVDQSLIKVKKSMFDNETIHDLTYYSDVHEIDAYAQTILSEFIYSIKKLSVKDQLKKCTEVMKSIPDMADLYLPSKIDGDDKINNQIDTIKKRYMKKLAIGIKQYVHSINDQNI